MDYAATNADDYEPNGPIPTNFADAIKCDPIATVRTLVRVVSIFRHLVLFHFANIDTGRYEHLRFVASFFQRY